MAGDTITDATIAPSNRQLPIPRTDEFNQEIDGFLRRPGRGGRALRRAAAVFLRLLTKPPLRPFSLLARFLASLQLDPRRLGVNVLKTSLGGDLESMRRQFINSLVSHGVRAQLRIGSL